MMAGIKKQTARVVFRLAVTVLLFTVAHGAAAMCEEYKVKEYRNIVFTTLDGLELKGDMYAPDGEGPFPGILSIHGGGFVGGSKDWQPTVPFVRKYAALGYVVFHVNYRLMNEGGIFPNNIKDVKCALGWMKEQAGEYGMDASRIGALGESAGAYLAAMVALTQNVPEFQPDCEGYTDADTSVSSAVLFYAPFNFTNFSNSFSKVLEYEMKRLAGLKTKKEVREFKKKYSATEYAGSAPPLFISNSDPDNTVPPEQSREMVALLEELGKTVEYVEVTGEGMDHGFIVMKPESPQALEAFERSAAFLEKYLKYVEK